MDQSLRSTQTDVRSTNLQYAATRHAPLARPAALSAVSVRNRQRTRHGLPPAKPQDDPCGPSSSRRHTRRQRRRRRDRRRVRHPHCTPSAPAPHPHRQLDRRSSCLSPQLGQSDQLEQPGHTPQMVWVARPATRPPHKRLSSASYAQAIACTLPRLDSWRPPSPRVD